MTEGRTRGRPRSDAAVSHDTILDTVRAILEEKSLKELTIEEVARRAGVGKPTIYKWWPSKAALVMDMFEERIAIQFAVPKARTAEEAIRGQVTEVIRLAGGFFGKVASEIIAEGQSDPVVLEEYRERYMSKRRAFTTEWIRKAQESGEFSREVEPDLLIDLIYGPIYYCLLVRHRKLDQKFGRELVDKVLSLVRTTPGSK